MGTKKGQKRKTARRAYEPIKRAKIGSKANVGPEGPAKWSMVWRAPTKPITIRATTKKLLKDLQRFLE